MVEIDIGGRATYGWDASGAGSAAPQSTTIGEARCPAIMTVYNGARS